MARGTASIGALAVLLSSLASCQQSLQQTAVETIAAAQGFITQAQTNHHDYCVANPTVQFPCRDIHDAVVAQNQLVNALEIYCGWSVPPTTAQQAQACSPAPSAKVFLEQALVNLTGALNNYKTLSGGKP